MNLIIARATHSHTCTVCITSFAEMRRKSDDFGFDAIQDRRRYSSSGRQFWWSAVGGFGSESRGAAFGLLLF